jgi:hypothetical protein
VISVIDRLTSGVPVCTAGEPGTGVSGSTLGRCEGGRDATGAGGAEGTEVEAIVILGVKLCGSLAGPPAMVAPAPVGAGVAGDDADGRLVCCEAWDGACEGACVGPC